MGVDDLAESLDKLTLDGHVVLRSDHGEIYTVDRSTGETLIKGSRRKDGTYRSDIKVKPGYIPPEERAKYVPRFKRDPLTAAPADNNAAAKVEPPEEAPAVLPPSTLSTDKDETTKGRRQRFKPRNRAKYRTPRKVDGGPPTGNACEPPKGTVVDVDEIAKKLNTAIRKTRKQIREAEAVKMRTEVKDPSKLPAKIQRANVLYEKLGRLQYSLSELKTTIAAKRWEPVP